MKVALSSLGLVSSARWHFFLELARRKVSLRLILQP